MVTMMQATPELIFSVIPILSRGFLGIAVLYTLCCLIEPSLDGREPTLVRSKFPLFGHIVGFLRFGSKYLEQIPQDEPVVTLNMFRKRVYVVTSLELSSALQRCSQTVSFNPVVKLMAICFSAFEPHLARLFDRDEKKAGLAVDTLKEYHRAFGPGAGSADLQVAMLDELMSILDRAETEFREPKPLYAWIKQTITKAAMRAVYGPAHPFKDPEVEKAFWTFELECAPLLLNFVPRILAPKAVAARETLTNGFTKYYENNGLSEASELAKARFNPPATYGLSVREIAQLESPFLFAVLATSVPACFWAFGEIYSRPNLLAELREELGTVIAADRDTQPPTFTVDIERLKAKCPLLLSTFQEILRQYSYFSLVRLVTEDTMLANRYLLKKDSVVLIPNNVIHRQTKIWGDDAGQTDFYRFMPEVERKMPGNALRSFGDAPNMCPGRHFATTEIMSTLAVLLMRYDFVPASGSWRLPPSHLAVFGAIMPPKHDLDASIRAREGWRGRWVFNLGNPAVKVPLICG